MNRVYILIFVMLATATAAWLVFSTWPDSPRVDEPVAAPRITPKEVAAHEPVAVRIRRLVDRLADMNTPWQDRVKAAHELPANLAADEVTILFEFLKMVPRAGEEEHYLVVNEVMEQLRLGGQAGEPFAGQLAALIADGSVDGVVRDYAIQHAANWLDPDGVSFDNPDTESVSADHRRILLDAMTNAVVDPANLESTIPGTGLTALAQLCITLPEELQRRTTNRLRPLVMSLIGGSLSSVEANRVAAVDVAASLGFQQALPQIRGLVISPETPPSLRLTGIAALGAFGKKEDTALLKELMRSGEKYVFAASEALRRVDSGQGTTPIPSQPLGQPKAQNAKKAASDDQAN